MPVADMANHICCLIQIRGGITAHDCQAAVERVVERQEVLRLSFLPGKERPVQMIRRTGETDMRTRELSSAQGHPEAVEELAREVFRAPFDLVQGPLFRVEVMRRAADDHIIVMAIHHAIADGWSLGVFVQDLCAAYLQGRMGVTDPLPPVPHSYSAWGAAERAFWQPAELASRAAFWKVNLAGRQRLWADNAASKSGPPQRWVTAVPADLARGAKELAKVSGVTLFSTLLAAFQLALSRWTGADDILVGTPVANRTKQAVRETMGYCAGIVPIRGQIDATLPFSEIVQASHLAAMDAFAHAMPFAELTQALGEPPAPGYNPIFEVRFALQNHPIPDVALPGLSAKLRMRSTGTARYSLACEITEQGDELEVVWLFWPGMFPLEAIENLDRIFQTVLAGACRSPEKRVAALVASA